MVISVLTILESPVIIALGNCLTMRMGVRMMPSEKPFSPTDVEWKLMQSLWKLKEPTIREVVEDVKETGWTVHSVISFLKRMAAKGMVAIEETRPIRYRALVEKDTMLRKETHAILDKVYGGDLMLMVTNAVDSADLTDEEINELIGILKKGR